MNPSQESKFNRWNDVDLWVSSLYVRTVRFLMFFGWNLCEMVRICFDSHSFVNLATFLWFFLGENSVRVRVWIERFELTLDSHHSGFCSDIRRDLVKLGCYLSFYSEIRTVRLILGLGFPLVSRFHSFLSSLDPDPVKSFTSSSSSSLIWILRSHL